MQAQDPRTPWMDAAEELGHVLRAQKGDRKAFLALLRHYHRPVYRLSFALTRDVRTAAAVTHAAVLKAKEGARYMAEGRRFFPWVASIVRNLARARHRPGNFAGPGAPGADPGAVELARRLLLAMDSLDPDEQAAVALHIAELLPHSLIEAVLRVTPGSAPPLLAGARSRLATLVPGAESRQVTHLAPDQLWAYLDGAREGESFDLVRHHLAECEICSAECLRMASASDLLSALLTHIPDDRFFEALQGFLEEQFNANDPADSIPPELESLLATESARLDAHRWAAVHEAIPRAPVIPASAVRPLGIAPRHEPAAPAEALEVTAVRPTGASEVAAVRPAEALEVAAVRPMGRVISAASLRSAPAPAPVPTPIPAMVSSPASKRKGPPRRSGGSGYLIEVVLVAVALLLAGLYFTQWGSRARAGFSRVASRFTGTAVRPVAVTPAAPPAVAPAALPAVAAAAPPAVAPAAPPAVAPAAPPAVALTTPRAVAPTAPPPIAPATPLGTASGATQRRASAVPRPAAPPPVAPDRGILCGQVRDERGMPIVRAQVLLADLRVGALTDPRGRFCISVPIGSRTVSVIALGFTTQRRTVTVGPRTPELAVTLRSAAVEESPDAGGP